MNGSVFRRFCRPSLPRHRFRQHSLHIRRHFNPLSTCRYSRPIHRPRSSERNSLTNNLLVPSRACSLFGASDTVFALSSGHGKCGVAVIRTTGPQSRECVLRLTGRQELPQPRKAVLRKLSDPANGDTIDHSLVLWFPAPHSFTGEDCAEFHVHGGPSVVLALLTALGRIPNCSHAQAGDFTKRAFFNGKLELTEVEGLADLIHAETEAQRKQALRQMEGDLGTLYSNWTQQLKKVVAHVEAVIDFGEDENIEDTVMDKVKSGAREIQEEIEVHLSDGRRGERLRSGVHVAILGAPNAGKSSLLNKLCQRPAAIVSPHAGTTRDVVESALDIAGYPVVLSDTAGLRLAHDPVEQEGVRRALSRVESADLCVLIGDLSVVGGQLLEENVSPPFTLPQLARHLLRSYSDHHSRSTEASSEGVGTSEWLERAVANLPSQSTLVVMNKTDLLGEEQRCLLERRLSSETDERLELCWLSCRTGDGVDQFMESFTSHLERLCGNPMAGNPSITQARHRQHLTQCALLLHNFIDWIESGDEMMLDKSAEELRTAIREIGRITGRIGVEDILDVVFSDFCIGK